MNRMMNYQHLSSIIMLLKGKNINLGTYFQVGVTFEALKNY